MNFQESIYTAFKMADKFQLVPINISGPGSTVRFETDTLVSMEQTLAVGLINTMNGRGGLGTLQLKLGDKEILPQGFHAPLITKHAGTMATRTKFSMKEYLFPVQLEAKGKPIKIHYEEPTGGDDGSLTLYLFGSKKAHKPLFPGYKVQVVELTVPGGDPGSEVEIPIVADTIKGHQWVAGAFFYGNTNRVKEVSLSVDGTTIIPAGMPSALAMREQTSPESISGGLYTKHILPLPQFIQPCNIKAQGSKIEGGIKAIPLLSGSYTIQLYLLTKDN